MCLLTVVVAELRPMLAEHDSLEAELTALRRERGELKMLDELEDMKRIAFDGVAKDENHVAREAWIESEVGKSHGDLDPEAVAAAIRETL